MWVRMFVFFLGGKIECKALLFHRPLSFSTDFSLTSSSPISPNSPWNAVNDLIPMTETSSVHVSTPRCCHPEKRKIEFHKMPNNGKAIEVIQNIIPHLTFASFCGDVRTNVYALHLSFAIVVFQRRTYFDSWFLFSLSMPPHRISHSSFYDYCYFFHVMRSRALQNMFVDFDFFLSVYSSKRNWFPC